MNSRLIALRILLKLEKNRVNSSLLLREALPAVENPRDRNLVTDLVMGVLRWRSRLLYFIECYSRRPLERIDPKIAGILQLGVYQLLTPGFPQHAAIHETVELCGLVKMSSAKSFVNGVLRQIQRALPDLPESPDLAVRWSHPKWLVERWLERFGREETVELLRTNQSPPPLLIRVNELKVTIEEVTKHLQQEGIEATPTSFGPAVLQVSNGAPQFTNSFSRGEFYIQDAATEILGNCIDANQGDRVLEISAAPGGKTFLLAMQMKNEGIIVSIDTDQKRMQLWKQNIERLGIRSAFPVIADATQPGVTGLFDHVLVDAPCSSLGVLRRHPEIKWWRRPDHFPGIQNLQVQILESSARHVRNGGKLLYSVCSFEPEETTDVIAVFLERSREFSLNRQLFLYPNHDGTDGFFIAALSRLS